MSLSYPFSISFVQFQSSFLTLTLNTYSHLYVYMYIMWLIWAVMKCRVYNVLLLMCCVDMDTKYVSVFHVPHEFHISFFLLIVYTSISGIFSVHTHTHTSTYKHTGTHTREHTPVHTDTNDDGNEKFNQQWICALCTFYLSQNVNQVKRQCIWNNRIKSICLIRLNGLSAENWQLILSRIEFVCNCVGNAVRT